MTDIDRLFPPAGEATCALIGQRVRRRDVPGTRGTVLRVVCEGRLAVRWDGYTVDTLEDVARLERLS